MNRLLLIFLICTGCALPLQETASIELSMGWQADYSVRVANVEYQLCRVHVEREVGVFACSKDGNLERAMHFKLSKEEIEVLEDAYKRLPELNPPTEKPWMTIRTKTEKAFIDDLATEDPSVSKFVKRVDDLLAKKSRLQRQESEIGGRACHTCGSQSYCRFDDCPSVDCDAEVCPDVCGPPEKICHLIKEIGARCYRDDECPSACVGIVGRCE